MESEDKKDKLRFVLVGGLKVYSPAESVLECPKKHACRDCHFCQFCSDARCQTCQSTESRNRQCPADKLSFSEQIHLYENANSSDQYE
ncbi:MAG: hypothetical protein RBS57_07855 [Desulforhabdus sp.]|jgi:hypothetical protein|nr:hypothetical protein [Desulforhabdus sp.]